MNSHPGAARAAIWARVSTHDQDTDNQLRELREWAARGCGHPFVSRVAQKEQLPGFGSLISLGAPSGMSCTTTFTRGTLPSFRTTCSSVGI